MIVHLPRDVRACNAMRKTINERALRLRIREADRIHAVCEGARMMVLGSSSAAAVQLGWRQLQGGVFTHIPTLDGAA